MPAGQGPQEWPRTLTSRSVEKAGVDGGQRPGRERVASQDFPGSDHGPGMHWAGISCFQEEEGVRKGLGSPKW